MLRELTGNILLSHVGAIAHGVAPHDNFEQRLTSPFANGGPACTKIFATTATPTIQNRGGLGRGRDRTRRSSSNLFTQEAAASDPDRPGQATLPSAHALQALKHKLQVHIGECRPVSSGDGSRRVESDNVPPLPRQSLEEVTIPPLGIQPV